MQTDILMQLGAYRTERHIADSPLGAIYEGICVETRERVLIQLLPPSARGDMQRLTRLQSQVHLLRQRPMQGIPTPRDHGVLADGRPYVVTDYPPGDVLATYQQRQGELPLDAAIRLGQQLARLLLHAQTLGIAHPALTSNDILLESSPGLHAPIVWMLGLGTAAPVSVEGQQAEDSGSVLALGTFLSTLLGARGATLPMEMSALLQQMTERSPVRRPALAEVVARIDAVVPLQAAATTKVLLPALPADPRIGMLFGNFRLVRKIGEGGMGVVYEAEHHKIGRRAAVKLLNQELASDEQYAQRFLNEARAVNIVRHRGLVEIFEFGKQPDGTLFYVMEFLEGESLQHRIAQRNSALSEQEAVSLASQIARALAAAHEKGIIHRDLKPENIMLVSDPVSPGLDWVKILDFGIAKVRSRSSTKTDPDRTDVETQVGAFMGTPLYMAPEQHGQAEQVDGKADVFSLGVVLYELLTGKLPFENSALSLLWSAPVPLGKLNPAVSKRLAELVGRMMAGRPAERPAMHEVVREFLSLLPKERRGRGQLWIAAGSITLLVGFLTLIFFRGKAHAPTPSELRSRARAVLAAYMKEPDAELRVLAVRALGQSRDRDQRPLLEPIVRSGDGARQEPPPIVEEAVRALGQIGAVDTQGMLVNLLEHSGTPGVRAAAAMALAQLQHPLGLDSLKRLLSEGDELAKIHTALLLLELGDATGAPLLWTTLNRGTLGESARVQLLGKLAASGDAAARQRLLDEFKRLSAGDARVQAAYALVRIGEDSGWASLKQAAMQPGPEQLLALRLLAGLGQTEGRAKLMELAAARSQPDSIRELVIAGLADSGRDDSLGMLASVLDERGASARLRIAVAGAILQITTGERARLGEQTLSWARAALGSSSVATRELAVAVLSDMASEQTVASLGEALKDTEREIRRSAARALGKRNTSAAVNALRTALDDPDPEVRTAVLQALGLVLKDLAQRGDRSALNPVYTQLRRMAAGASERDRVVASGILLQVGEAAPAEQLALQVGLTSVDAYVRRLAIELSDPSPQVLKQALSDPELSVRFAAARQLAVRGSRDGIEVLREVALQGSRDGLVAYSTLRRLGELVMPPQGLGGILNSGDLTTRLTVLEFLPELPPSEAFRLIQIALLDAAAVIRRRVVDVAAVLYRQTRQPHLLRIVYSLRADTDVLVRTQAAVRADELAALPSQQEGPVKPEGPVKDEPEPGRASTLKAPPSDPEKPQPTEGMLVLDGDEGVRIQIDKGPTQALAGKPIPLASGKHRVSYLGGVHEVLVPSGQTVRVRVPVTLADQLLQDGKDALGRKDLQHAQESLDSLRRLAQRGRASSSMQADLSYQQARLFEARQQLDAALTEYNRALNVPANLRRPELNAALQSTLSRLSSKVGRVQIFTLVNGKCEMTRELLFLPGEQVISLGLGKTRTVYARVGSATQVMACQL